MSTKKYNGVVVPMVTPVTPSGMLDKPAVERIIKGVNSNVQPNANDANVGAITTE